MLELRCFVAGKPVEPQQWLVVNSPYHGKPVGRVALASREDTERALATGRAYRCDLTRHQRYEILMKTRAALQARQEEFARLITAETGLCIRETRYETGRTSDVLQFAAIEALKDDGQTFSCDISEQGKARKIFTLREPHALAVAITPFNHPLNQVAHKVAPAIAAGTPLILKPSEKTPLTALRFVELLYEAGLPGEMLSAVVGATEEVAAPLTQDPRVEVLTFTGSVRVGKHIAATAGYKKLVLELGGNDPLIVLADADLDLAAHLAAEGAFRNSGQRCTAIKRILVEKSVLEPFTAKFVAKAKEYVCGDPDDPDTRVGTVIDEASATHLESLVRAAEAQGARVLLGGERRGALLAPTVIAEVPRNAFMVCEEAFGPLAPILAVDDLEDAIALSNATPYGLSSGIVTRNLESALRAIQGLRVGTVNVNEVPGYRIESSPFGGIKDSGLGVKEGVIETIKYMTSVKTFSLPWQSVLG